MKHLILPLLIALTLALPAQALDIQGAGAYALSAGTTGGSELSGIAYAGGAQFYAVSDSAAKVYPLTISIDPVTGAIASAALSSAMTLSTGSDLEGIAYDRATGGVLVSDETGPAIRAHSLADGSVTGTVAVPSVYGDIRTNYSLESLSLRADGGALWTANEEALSGDGPLSTVGAGTTVRLQKFDAELAPAGQWAYQTDGITADIPLTSAERSGVSDLCVLPNGTLLVLERELGLLYSPFGPYFRNRIYEVDLAGATDVSAIDDLDGAAFTPVSKSLLWEGYFASANYEGIALGPALAEGAWSLVLISDDGSGLTQSLYALTLSGDVATPGDANLDGRVDGADLATWQANYDPLGLNAEANTWAMGDWDGSGTIDGGDLALWQGNYNPLGLSPSGAPDDIPFAPTEVPEPATLALLAAGCVVGVLRRRTKKRASA